MQRSLTTSDIRALVRLLGDPAEATFQVARARLLAARRRAIPALKTATSDPEAVLRGRARLLLQEIRRLTLAESAARYAAGGRDLDLEEGAFLAARVLYPEVDARFYRVRLDEMAREVRTVPGWGACPRRAATALTQYLFGHWGFRGDPDHLFDPEGACLNRVLDRRRGGPVALGVVYLLLAGRLRLAAEGVAMPGHFLVRVGGRDDPFWVDPFQGGAILSAHGVAERLSSLGYPFHLSFLETISTRQVVARLLAELARACGRSGDSVRAKEAEALAHTLLEGHEPER